MVLTLQIDGLKERNSAKYMWLQAEMEIKMVFNHVTPAKRKHIIGTA